MSFDELHEKVSKASMELRCNGLERFGYSVQIELSINTYRELLCDYQGRFAIKTEVDDPKERIHRGTIYGIPFILTQDTDRVLIAKESE